METYYTDEKNVQIVIALLKSYNIRKVIVSPGTTNITFVASIQQDSFFEMFSSADERSAAYIACGLAAECGEPVVLSCTGATASRNYIPGLTEAYYRKLPIVAITACHRSCEIGQNIAQVLDRTRIQKDIAKCSVLIPYVFDNKGEWDCILKVNKVLTELTRHGGGPVHINLESTFSKNYTIKKLPNYRKISYVNLQNQFPQLPEGKIVVYCSSHKKWTETETKVVDDFCSSNNAVVLCDQTSNYKGQYRVLSALLFSQEHRSDLTSVDLLIHIGEISGDYYTSIFIKPKEVWRVSEDGEIRDTFQKLSYVFEMPEEAFFRHYTNKENKSHTLMERYKKEYQRIYESIPELPFSNLYIAQNLSLDLPKNSVLHLGILNTLRSWNFFEIDTSILSYSNVGGFGIDGDMSSLIGASLANPQKLYFGILGDLAFFYDMNSLGNRNIKPNLRILLVNNGRGTEFRNYSHDASRFGEDADKFIAAAGHYGNKSHELVKHYATDLGFDYVSASNKDEFQRNIHKFISPQLSEKPIIFECFTDTQDENDALWLINHIDAKDASDFFKEITNKGKKIAKGIIGKENIRIIKEKLG